MAIHTGDFDRQIIGGEDHKPKEGFPRVVYPDALDASGLGSMFPIVRTQLPGESSASLSFRPHTNANKLAAMAAGAALGVAVVSLLMVGVHESKQGPEENQQPANSGHHSRLK